MYFVKLLANCFLLQENDFPKKDEPTDDDSSTLKGSSENSCFDNFKDSCSVSSLDALSFSDEDNSAGGVGSELTGRPFDSDSHSDSPIGTLDRPETP